MLQITSRLLRDQSTVSASAAWSLARTTMICCNDKIADQQLQLILQQHFGSRESDNQRPRMPLNVLFSSYLRCRLGSSPPGDLWRSIAFLEPSDAADAELLWMVNTSHRTMGNLGRDVFGRRLRTPLRLYIGFFAAVLTYISSTEQSRRSKAPLTVGCDGYCRTAEAAVLETGTLLVGQLTRP
jgi:hypothetical protein